MNANKTIDPGTLQSQAEALVGTHAGHTITCYGSPSNYDVRCYVTSTSEVVELCSTGQTALANYTPPAPPLNANVGFINHLNGISLTAGGEAALLRDQVVQYLQTQPSVPAV
ncbi:MAG: hypothetical protein KGJ86_00225 [Chloroflexota bacterium]|nr:hypothetical protein [Chloroflexota bacterium]